MEDTKWEYAEYAGYQDGVFLKQLDKKRHNKTVTYRSDTVSAKPDGETIERKAKCCLCIILPLKKHFLQSQKINYSSSDHPPPQKKRKEIIDSDSIHVQNVEGLNVK